MKNTVIVLLVCTCAHVYAQEKETTPINEQQLENQAALEEAGTEDDAYWQHLEFLRTHKLNLNRADKSDLEELQMLSAIQIDNFFRYRTIFGAFISIYELQAIPGWDVESIKKLLPFVTISESETVTSRLKKRFIGGENTLLMRFSEVLEKAAGFKETAGSNYYTGSRDKLLFRYKYNYKNLLQYGLTGDKDAGESFFKGQQSAGFDFYSAHLFIRRLGAIKSLAIGDYTVNLGQGLIQWQSLAFKKGAAVLDVKRQSPALKPYNSAGEFNFFRGAGITVQYKKLEATVFGSFRRLSTNLITDSLNDLPEYISSISTSGYSRTPAELADRNNTAHIAAGGNLRLRHNNGHVAFNLVQHHFSNALGISNAVYDRYSITGNNWSNYSIDYSYTVQHLHLFGEIAADRNSNHALLQGLLINLDAKTAMAFVYRHIDKAYQSLFSNAFTENATPSNESGLYAGISIKPAWGWKIDAYADFFRFPWLKFRADAPGYGHDYLLQVTYTPSKQVEIYSRFKYEAKTMNEVNSNEALHFVWLIPKANWRTQIGFQLNTTIALRHRVELTWYNNKSRSRENGFLWFGDVLYKPLRKKYSFTARLLYVETGGYNSRMYAYENSGLYSFSIPAFYDKGFRYFLNAAYRLSYKFPGSSKKANCRVGLHAGQSVYPQLPAIGTALDAISGNKKTEVSVQVIVTW